MAGKWIVRPRPRPAARLRLFCFSCAGGSAQVFVPWADGLPPTVEVCPVELPGHGRRFTETPFRRLPDLVEGLVKGLGVYLDRPFALFGHSLGALVAFELARGLRRLGRELPVQLFVSAYQAPHLDNPEATTYKLPDRALVAKIQRLGGTPPQVLQEPELIDLILPVLRADFELLGTYRYGAEPALDCPIGAFGGLSDRIANRERLAAWQNHTSTDFTLQMFPGDHFFLQSVQPLFLGVLNRALDLALR